MAKEIGLESFLGEKEPDFRDVPFEKGLKLLEELVGKVEQGALPLDQAMCAYERGVHLVEHLQKQLQGAEERLKVLKKKGTGAVCGPDDVETSEA